MGFPTLCKSLCFSSCLFKAAPPKHLVFPNWSAHTCLRQHRVSGPLQLPVSVKAHVVQVCDAVIPKGRGIKGRTTDEEFQALLVQL